MRLNRFLTSRPEMISVKDNLASWTVEVPLATAGLIANAGWPGATLGGCRLTTFRLF